MRLKLLFSESVRSLGANLSTTIAATMTVLIGMFLLGLFIALGSWAQAFGDHQKEKLLVKVYFCTDSTCKQEATNKQINAVRAKLTADPLVKQVTWVSKAEALERMRKLQPEIVENLPGNPLPDAFEVTPVDGEHAKEIGRNLRAPTLPPGIEKINDGGAVSDRVVTVARVLSSAFLVATIVLLICDEPTGNLDPDTSVGIMQLLYRINRAGTTILMVTHDREMVDKMRRRVIALEDGRLARDERRGGYESE